MPSTHERGPASNGAPAGSTGTPGLASGAWVTAHSSPCRYCDCSGLNTGGADGAGPPVVVASGRVSSRIGAGPTRVRDTAQILNSGCNEAGSTASLVTAL